MPALRGAVVLVWLAVGLWRLFVSLSLVVAPEPPVLALLAVATQAAAALAAAAAIAGRRAGLAQALAAAFVVAVALQMGVDVVVHGIRSLVEAGVALLAALAFVAASALVLRAARWPVRASL